MSKDLFGLEEPKMTIKEMAGIMGISERNLRRYVSRCFPDLMQNGKITYLNEIQVTRLKLEIEKNPNLDADVQVKTNLEKELIIQQALMFQA